MGKKYLIDTNILIYYFANQIPKKELSKIEIIFEEFFNVSIITKIEFLGWNKHTENGFLKSKEFINNANVININDEIADSTIKIRRETNVKLPDAIISATALFNNLILITRNEEDFERVKNLEIYNPFETEKQETLDNFK